MLTFSWNLICNFLTIQDAVRLSRLSKSHRKYVLQHFASEHVTDLPLDRTSCLIACLRRSLQCARVIRLRLSASDVLLERVRSACTQACEVRCAFVSKRNGPRETAVRLLRCPNLRYFEWMDCQGSPRPPVILYMWARHLRTIALSFHGWLYLAARDPTWMMKRRSQKRILMLPGDWRETIFLQRLKQMVAMVKITHVQVGEWPFLCMRREVPTHWLNLPSSTALLYPLEISGWSLSSATAESSSSAEDAPCTTFSSGCSSGEESASYYTDTCSTSRTHTDYEKEPSIFLSSTDEEDEPWVHNLPAAEINVENEFVTNCENSYNSDHPDSSSASDYTDLLRL